MQSLSEMQGILFKKISFVLLLQIAVAIKQTKKGLRLI